MLSFLPNKIIIIIIIAWCSIICCCIVFYLFITLIIRVVPAGGSRSVAADVRHGDRPRIRTAHPSADHTGAPAGRLCRIYR